MNVGSLKFSEYVMCQIVQKYGTESFIAIGQKLRELFGKNRWAPPTPYPGEGHRHAKHACKHANK